ncbi:DUF6238 family protein, partial [Streptomyces sp. NPDC088554]|uniref:DUF6238 family protein n=1 Tax=Streptomyces sp. NPDC088554 TaxID=3365865 RepID=UPI00381AA770
MSRTASSTAQDFVPFATAALDFHRALNIPGGPLVTTRAELDALHAHLVALHGLLDAHAARTGQLVLVPHQATFALLWRAVRVSARTARTRHAGPVA